MNAIIGLGKYLFAIPFAVFGFMHFAATGEMAEMTPFGGEIIVYISGLGLILAAISILIGKMDKLATVLLALLMLLTALTVHLPEMNAGNEMAMGQMLRDLALAGASLVYAGHAARDKALIG